MGLTGEELKTGLNYISICQERELSEDTQEYVMESGAASGRGKKVWMLKELQVLRTKEIQ